MKNPWEEIALMDYENHMKLPNIHQIQVLNTMMNDQFYEYPVKSIMILGIAGGNGLEHINRRIIDKVYGVDLNREYLEECRKRYSYIEDILELLCVDLMEKDVTLPHADLLVANLLLEYIGYECFQNVIKKVQPTYISCGIQVNPEGDFVSESPYLHIFDGLETVHTQIEESSLIRSMEESQYAFILKKEHDLPNGKKLVRLDFARK